MFTKFKYSNLSKQKLSEKLYEKLDFRNESEKKIFPKVKALIEAKANVNYCGGDHIPLGIASYKGYARIVKLLLDAKADVERYGKCGSGSDTTALGAAIIGASLHGEEKSLGIIHMLVEMKVLVNGNMHLSVDPESYLGSALRSKHFTIAKILIENKASPNSVGIFGDPVLSIAFYGGFHSLDTTQQKANNSIINLLIERKADINQRSNDPHCKTKNCVTTPLYEAMIYHYDISIVKKLITHRAQVNVWNDHQCPHYHGSGDSPLLEAIENKRFDVIKVLLEAKAEINITSPIKGKLPLIEAAKGGDLEIVKTLVEAKAQVTMRENGKTAAQWARYNNFHTVVNYLKPLEDKIFLVEKQRNERIAKIKILRQDAQRKVEQKDFVGAIKDYDALIKMEPEDYLDSLAERGRAKLNHEDFHSAIKDFDEVLYFEEKNARVLYNRGYCRINVKDYNGAIADFSKCIQLKPDNIFVLQQRGYCYHQLKNFAAASADYNKILQREPQNGEVLTSFGNLKRDLKDYRGARENYLKAIYYGHKPAQEVLTSLETEQKSSEEASQKKRSHQEESKKEFLPEKEAETFFKKGEKHYKTGDYANAIRNFKLALNLGYTQASSALSTAETAKIRLEQEQAQQIQKERQQLKNKAKIDREERQRIQQEKEIKNLEQALKQLEQSRKLPNADLKAIEAKYASLETQASQQRYALFYLSRAEFYTGVAKQIEDFVLKEKLFQLALHDYQKLSIGNFQNKEMLRLLITKLLEQIINCRLNQQNSNPSVLTNRQQLQHPEDIRKFEQLKEKYKEEIRNKMQAENEEKLSKTSLQTPKDFDDLSKELKQFEELTSSADLKDVQREYAMLKGLAENSQFLTFYSSRASFYEEFTSKTDNLSFKRNFYQAALLDYEKIKKYDPENRLAPERILIIQRQLAKMIEVRPSEGGLFSSSGDKETLKNTTLSFQYRG